LPALTKTHGFRLFLHGALVVVVVVSAVSVLNGIKLMKTVEETTGWLREGMISSLKYSNDISTLVARGTRLGDVRITDFTVHEVILEPKDAIIWYTDGITENENAEHEPYGDRRFRRVINRSAFLSAEQARDAIIEDVTDYYGGYPLKDDVTLVVGRVG
jgi:hypothetical protein